MPDFIDLHTHSSASDGCFSPRELIRYAKQKGLKAIALTDHDTINGLKDAVDEGKKIGIEVIPGVELSADDDVRIHIVGLNINYENKSILTEKLEFLRNGRNKRLFEVVKLLNNIGINITVEDIQKKCPNGNVGKPHIAAAMIENGFATTVRQACETYLDKGCPAYVKRDKTTSEEAVKLIKEAGGVPIFAHPGMLKKKMTIDEIENVVQRLKGYGCMGLETYYSDYDEITTKEFENIAKKYNLLVSGGSDFHGEKTKPGIDLGIGRGNLNIDYEILERIKLFMALK